MQARHWQLVRLYALADKYDIATLRNDIVDKFFATFSAPIGVYSQSPSLELVEYVYTNSSKRSALRDLLAAVFCWKVPHSRLSRVGVKDYLEGVPALAADIVLAMAQKLLGNGDPFKGKASNYYEIVSHEDPNSDQDEALV